MGGFGFRFPSRTDDIPRWFPDEGSEIFRSGYSFRNRNVIQNPFVLSILLLGLVLGILSLEKFPSFKKLFHYLPSAFWCYFVPMLLATFGILPDHSPVYDFLTTYVLSACLVLL